MMETLTKGNDEGSAERVLSDVESALNEKILETRFDPKYFDGLFEALKIVKRVSEETK